MRSPMIENPEPARSEREWVDSREPAPCRVASVSGVVSSGLLLLLWVLALAGCGQSAALLVSSGDPASGKETDLPKVQRQVVPEAVLEASNGLFIQRLTESDLEFVEWRSELTANRAIRSLRKEGGGTLYFAPGRYVVRHGMWISAADGIALIAAPNVELVFPDREAQQGIRLAEAAYEGQRHLTVDNVEGLAIGGRYQLFPGGGKGGRLLEFTVKKVEGTKLTIGASIKFMTHVKEIPEGSVVIEELNFFRVSRSRNVTIQGFAMDGRNRGKFIGHTTSSGIIVGNSFNAARAEGRPVFSGLRILDNSFRNLRGRGVAIYGTDDAIVTGNHLANIRTQAIEIDHFSAVRVHENTIKDSFVGIQLDDAYNSIVEDNLLEGVRRGIVFVGHFDDPWANTGNKILRNRLVGPGKTGVQLSTRSRDNIIAGNEFTAIERPLVGEAGENVIGENVIRQGPADSGKPDGQ